MPYNVPPDQWTPEYAAQVLAIQQQAMAQNPALASGVDPTGGIVPMGSPGSLTPPMFPSGGGEAASYDALQSMNAPSPIPTPPPPMNVQPGGSQTPSMGNPPGMAPIPGGGGVMDKLQQMLPYIASMGYGMDPKTRHMAGLPLMLGQHLQQQRSQEQTLALQTNLSKVLKDQGPEGARKYLAETIKGTRIDPKVMQVVQERIQEVEKQGAVRSAMQNLSGGDIKGRTAAITELIGAGMDAKEAVTVAKELAPNLEFMNVDGAVFVGDKQTGEVKEVKGPAMKGLKINEISTPVRDRLLEMGLNPADVVAGIKQEHPDAMAALQRAAQDVREFEARDKAEGRRTQLTAADIAAKGAVSAAVTSGRLQAEREEGMMDKNAGKELAGLKSIHEQFTDIYNAFDPSYQGPVRGRWGRFTTAAGWASPEEVQQRTRTVAAMNKKLREDSGLAVTDAELQRKLQELPQPEDPPDVFRTKLRLAIEDSTRDYGNRYQYYNSRRSDLPERLENPRFEGQKSPKGRVIKR